MPCPNGSYLTCQADGFPYRALDLCLLKKKVFSSWDRFQIPYPWTKGLFVWGDPLWVPPDLGKEALVEQGMELERALNTLTGHADLAVQQSDPLGSFLHAMNDDSPAIHE